ncbi:MAG TPA: diguanylate cyclase [Burkholderiales bacterium]|nr:diguanylate cyclase [Burkholderiales bacterium]
MPESATEQPALYENSIVGLGVLCDGRVLKANHRLAETFGYGIHELLATPLAALYPSADALEALEASARAQLAQCGAFAKDVRLRRKDGAHFWARCGLDAIDRDDLSKGLLWTVLDVTEIKQAEQALRESAAQLRLFADNVPAMSIVYDETLHCLYANKRFAEYFGLTTESIVGKHLREIVGEEAHEEIKVHFDRVLQGYPTGYERSRRLPDGECRYLDVKLIPHIGEQGQVRGLFAVTSDITERKEQENRIRQLAQRDALTGVANRLLFDEHLRRALSLSARTGHRVALLYIDLDKFKPVNDTLGHDAGDELLKSAAERITRQVRESDTVARLGGDEFAVILPHIAGPQDAAVVAQRILDALGMPFHLPPAGRDVRIGSSIGIAICPADAWQAEALVKAADAAMYKAKQSGNCYSFCEPGSRPAAQA